MRRNREFVDLYSQRGSCCPKATVTLFENIQDFLVAEVDGLVVGCGALHVIWEDLGELRTLAVAPHARGAGIGRALVEALLERARALGVSRVSA